MSVRATARVKQIYVRRDVTYIKLDIPATEAPQEELFTLDIEHPNSNALYSLLLAAAANGWPLTVRIAGDLDIGPERSANVSYLVVNF
jgi:hypothetical protein